ncbi:MAG: non-heme iron oxygenase ferredoxin subunit [Actinobacteria bacterium]|jgi:3-phenylpropionate/trans-cinnamate dioxygenase ferredoxin subunit|nr:non-heme iron oxygenase ferredoxin subunit [Actinomycetota bacterium]
MGGTTLSQKIDLCHIDEVKSGTAARFDVDGHRIALVRIEESFYAIGDRCTHANYSLAEGEVYAEEKEIECWKHGSTFSLVTGKPTCLPATKAVPVYDVVIEGERVMVVVS